MVDSARQRGRAGLQDHAINSGQMGENLGQGHDVLRGRIRSAHQDHPAPHFDQREAHTSDHTLDRAVVEYLVLNYPRTEIRQLDRNYQIVPIGLHIAKRPADDAVHGAVAQAHQPRTNGPGDLLAEYLF